MHPNVATGEGTYEGKKFVANNEKGFFMNTTGLVE